MFVMKYVYIHSSNVLVPQHLCETDKLQEW